MTISEGSVGITAAYPPPVKLPEGAPAKVIDASALRMMGMTLSKRFTDYKGDRRIQEERWLRNLRQYLGIYDPDVQNQMGTDRSRAYPKLTRVKCIVMLSRLMDLLFPSDDRNWTLEARPSTDMDIEDVKLAVATAVQRDTAANGQAPTIDDDYVNAAVQELAEHRAIEMTTLIDDQLQELGGDQSYSWITLNAEAIASGLMNGIGLMRGPFVRQIKSSSWMWNPQTQQPEASENSGYMPMMEMLSCWDFYPDMSSKRLEDRDGYFVRKVMSKSQLRMLADREDFFGDVIKEQISRYPNGNYKMQEFETELRTMGTQINTNMHKPEGNKYEIIIWQGYLNGRFLAEIGEEIDPSKMTDQFEAEVWMIDNVIIKAQMDDWARIGVKINTLHYFIFDKDDTSPIGFGLPNVMRDSQMNVSAAARMMLDNASVVCGPMVEMNTELLSLNQDLTAMGPWKQWYRDDTGPTAQWPAVREIKVDAHITELKTIIELFMQFADLETFVTPLAGGDMTKAPSEPLRNLAGASMLMGAASLPFKQVVRNIDKMTASVIASLVEFNRTFNPDKAKVADYDTIPRGATSLIAKEVRAAQLDQLSTTLSPEEKLHIDERKMLEAKLRSRDLEKMLVSLPEYLRRKQAQDQSASAQQALAQGQQEAMTRNFLAQAFKNMAQGNKNQATASAEAINAALSILQQGSDQEVQELIGRINGNAAQTQNAAAEQGQVADGGAVQPPAQGTAQPNVDNAPGADGAGAGVDQGPPVGGT